jgi:hypothetical protein
MSGDELHNRGIGALPIPSESKFFSIRLRAALEAIPPSDRDAGPTRANVRQLLVKLNESLGSEFALEAEASDGNIIVTQHWSMAWLEHLIDALSDLDRGISTPLLKPMPNGPSAALSRAQRGLDEVILEGVEVVRNSPDIDLKGKSPGQFVAEKLNEGGDRMRGELYTAAKLRNLKLNLPKRKPLSP